MIGEWLRRVSQLGDEVLGINARNLQYIYPLNPRSRFEEVDDKLLTKEILGRHGVPTPRTLGIFERFADLQRLPEIMCRATEGFVVKPATGAGGKGILVVRRNADGRLVAPGRRGERRLEPDDVAEHLIQILSGLHAPTRLTERAFLEELLEPDEVLGALSYGGLPDIRVVLDRGQPAMAMLRLPTRQSTGRANLHQGALGVGIDLASGETTHAIVRNRSIERHPDKPVRLRGVRVPAWERLLELARRAAASVGLGYIGVDLCVDRRQGPMIIEINARPGLNIQLANHTGLRDRLGEPP